MAAAPTLSSVYREVRDGTLRPVYYLTGPEDVLKDELAKHIIEHAVEPGSRDFNLDIRSAGDLDGESLHALVETPPMLAERRVVYVKSLEHWRKNAKVWKVLLKYVEHPSPTTVLIVTHSAGEKPHTALANTAFTLTVDRLSPSRVVRWIERRAKDNGFAIDHAAASFLQQVVGDHLMTLTTEIAKLGAVVQEGTPATPELVGQLVGVRQGETPDDWVSVVLQRDTGRAIGMLENVLAVAGVTGVRLVSQLGTSLIGVRLARALLDAGAQERKLPLTLFEAIRGARPAGLGDWKVASRRWADAAGLWTRTELDRGIRAGRDADKALKSTTVTGDRGILTEMLLTTGGRKAAA